MLFAQLASSVLLIIINTVWSLDECKGKPYIVSRAEWKARDPVRVRPMTWPVSHVIIYHTVSPECYTPVQCVRDVQFFQDYHMDYKGWWNIGYSFLIGGDGRAYVGNGWNETGAHSINYNTKSIGIAFIGNYMEKVPSDEMITATLELIACGVRLGYLTPSVEVHGHRDVSCSLAPGDAFYKIIRTWKNYKGGRMRDFYCSQTSTTSGS